MTITEFLLAQIAKDEAFAQAASPSPWSYGDVESVAGGMLYDKTRTIGGVYYEQPEDHDGSIVRNLLVPEADANGKHIARHDPARVLAECEAKRRIVELHSGSAPWCGWTHDAGSTHGDDLGDDCDTMRALASAYANHPAFDPTWRV